MLRGAARTEWCCERVPIQLRVELPAAATSDVRSALPAGFVSPKDDGQEAQLRMIVGCGFCGALDAKCSDARYCSRACRAESW